MDKVSLMQDEKPVRVQLGKPVRERNNELTVLKALGILAVVSCHLGTNVFNLMGMQVGSSSELFPEYSYHMPLFVFISGYFYKRVYESDVLGLVRRRFSSITKYAKCNLFYFVLCFALIHLGLYEKHIVFSLKNLIVEPFLGGFQFYFNGPAWFVPFLFLVQVSYVCLRRFVDRWLDVVAGTDEGDQVGMNFKQEVVFFVVLVIVGSVAVWVSSVCLVEDGDVRVLHSLLRVLFGLQFFELGFLYKEFIEEKVDLSVTSFFVVVMCKVAVYLMFGYYTFSLRIVKFNGHVVLPFVVSVLGILYCLHLAKFVMKVTDGASSKVGLFICLIGDNTWSIMMHHLLVKWSLGKVYEMSWMPEDLVVVADYLVSPLLCVVLPLVFVRVYERVASWLRKCGFFRFAVDRV